MHREDTLQLADEKQMLFRLHEKSLHVWLHEWGYIALNSKN